jgi:hypothetical protein
MFLYIFQWEQKYFHFPLGWLSKQSVCICTRQKSLSARTFSEIANSIWQTNLVFTLFWVRAARRSLALFQRVAFARFQQSELWESERCRGLRSGPLPRAGYLWFTKQHYYFPRSPSSLLNSTACGRI